MLKPVHLLAGSRTVTDDTAARAKFQFNLSNATKGTRFSVIYVFFNKITLNIPAIALGPMRVERREKSGDPGGVLPSRKVLGLPRTAPHSGRIDAQIVAKEVHLFIGACTDDTDLL